ncbi:hypothetical protein MKX42_23475 [Paenibacillus sp. FSL R7-0204]|uniref:hypothetical protein n=1 Tax=Paenibacillus sp. FSL R7-0204 TaxID=2921675 RepID=UPI0030FBB074
MTKKATNALYPAIPPLPPSFDKTYAAKQLISRPRDKLRKTRCMDTQRECSKRESPSVFSKALKLSPIGQNVTWFDRTAGLELNEMDTTWMSGKIQIAARNSMKILFME